MFEHDGCLFFSYVFWLGDLNYRINETIDNIKGLCGKKEYSTLWKHDQVEYLFHSRDMDRHATLAAISSCVKYTFCISFRENKQSFALKVKQ